MLTNERQQVLRWKAYHRYQDASHKARDIYLSAGVMIWADIAYACVQLALTEPRPYPEALATEMR